MITSNLSLLLICKGLTDNGSNPQKISSNIFEVMADYLAVGIDPQKTTICLQSALPALAEGARHAIYEYRHRRPR